MRWRDSIVATLLVIVVLLLAALWIILLRMRPLDAEMLRAPGFSQMDERDFVTVFA